MHAWPEPAIYPNDGSGRTFPRTRVRDGQASVCQAAGHFARQTRNRFSDFIITALPCLEEYYTPASHDKSKTILVISYLENTVKMFAQKLEKSNVRF